MEYLKLAIDFGFSAREWVGIFATAAAPWVVFVTIGAFDKYGVDDVDKLSR